MLLRISFIVLIFMSVSTLHAESSWKSWFSWFNTTKQEVVSQEFKDVKSIGLYAERGKVSFASWDQDTVYVEYRKKGSEEVLKHIEVEMKRKHTHHLDIEVDCEKGSVDFTVMVPRFCKLVVSLDSGELTITDIAGEIKASVESGKVYVKNPEADTSIKQEVGKVCVECSKKVVDTLLSVNSEKGKIEIKRLEEFPCRVLAKSESKDIVSQIPITLDKKTMKLTKSTWNDFKKNIQGYIGSDKTKNIMQLQTRRGKITIVPIVL